MSVWSPAIFVFRCFFPAFLFPYNFYSAGIVLPASFVFLPCFFSCLFCLIFFFSRLFLSHLFLFPPFLSRLFSFPAFSVLSFFFSRLFVSPFFGFSRQFIYYLAFFSPFLTSRFPELHSTSLYFFPPFFPQSFVTSLCLFAVLRTRIQFYNLFLIRLAKLYLFLNLARQQYR
jgi:hypothetical protein